MLIARPSALEVLLSRIVLVANPSFDVYGADLQMLESVRALRAAGWHVIVTSPTDGPLVPQLEELGAEPMVMRYPVLRRADSSATGVLRLAFAALLALPRLTRRIRSVRPDLCLVNTVTLPWWLLAGRLSRTPVVSHVHEAEPTVRRSVRLAMALPLMLAHTVVFNSSSSLHTVCDSLPPLRRRARLVYNGVAGPERDPVPPEPGGSTRVVCLGRLSTIKGSDLALEAVAILRRDGRDVHLDLCGSVVPGHEGFLQRLHERAEQPDLQGGVTFSGYVSPVWDALARSDVFLTPARADTFGNAVVEAQLAMRPVVATAVQGHLETVVDGETGLHVPSEDPAAMAAAVARLIDDPALARRLADQGRDRAADLFGIQRYRDELMAVLDELVADRTRVSTR
jgi:glycosyltransferase involved in cell wall biosynthesis